MLEGLFQPMHLLVIFFIAMLIFGPKKISDLGKGLGQGIREFKNAVNQKDAPPPSTPVPHAGEQGNSDKSPDS
jgi:sec-independent protein translocase protein TatA